MAVNHRVWIRKTHRWGAILVAGPFLLVLVTGILLQLKKDWSWVQPPTIRGTSRVPAISLHDIMGAARSRPEAGIQGWDDIARVDVQPDRGIAKVLSRNRWEIQVELATGAVLQTAYRRSDLIESLHDGSWFHDRAKLGVFLPVAIVIVVLWATGLYLFFLPHAVKLRRRGNQSR